MVRLTQIVHILHGMLGAIAYIFDWKLSVFLFLQFLLYEYAEESKVKDELYRELKEWSSGFAVVISIIIALRIYIGAFI